MRIEYHPQPRSPRGARLFVGGGLMGKYAESHGSTSPTSPISPVSPPLSLKGGIGSLTGLRRGAGTETPFHTGRGGLWAYWACCSAS